jgi:DNA-binding CsgD family transcriptional regulator/PAS domain-containing protein
MKKPSENIHKVALDSISAHVAIIDEQGVILETNRAWREFALANGMAENPGSIGVNYLEVCRRAGTAEGEEPAAVASAIEGVVRGDIREFFLDYPCHSSGEERWFALRILPFREAGSHKVILTHENITPLILVQRSLAKKERLMREQAEKLEEGNIALKVLLRHREEDRRTLEENMLGNVRELILPYVERLLEGEKPGKERLMLELIEERLQEIISPFLGRLTSLHKILTPREIHVAAMVREGRSSQEIADVLTISVSAVDFHRKQIRKKLGMTGSGRNLRSYLLSLQ